MSRSGRLLGLLLGLAAATVLALSGLLVDATPVHADETIELALKFHADEGWVTSIDEDLFAVDRGAWSPQGRLADIAVRNRADAPADIDVLIDRAPGNDPVDNPLWFEVQVVGEAWSPISDVDTGRTISLQQVGPHRAVRIRLHAVLRQSGPAERGLMPADGAFRVSVVKSSAATSVSVGESRGNSNLYLAPIFLVVALLLLSAISVRRRLVDKREP